MNQKRYPRVQEGMFSSRIKKRGALPQPLLTIPPTTIFTLRFDIMVSLAKRLMVLRIPKQFQRSFMWNDMVNNNGKGNFLLILTIYTKRMFNQIRPPVLLPTRTITSLCSSTSFCVFRFIDVVFAIESRSDVLTTGVSTRFHRFTRYDYHPQSTDQLQVIYPYYQHNPLQQQSD